MEKYKIWLRRVPINFFEKLNSTEILDEEIEAAKIEAIKWHINNFEFHNKEKI